MSMLIQQVKVFLVERPDGGVSISKNREALLRLFHDHSIKEDEIPYFAIPEPFENDHIYYISPEKLLGP